MSALTAALHDAVQPLERNAHPRRRLDLRHAKRLKELLQKHFARIGRRTMVGSIDIASVVIRAAYIERVTAFETEHDSILIVHAHGVQPSHVTAERVRPVSGRHF